MRKLWIFSTLFLLLYLTAPSWKPLARKSKWFLIGTNIGHDMLRRTGIARGQIGANTGGARRDLSELDRGLENYASYLRYARLEEADFAGKKLFEIGPGDNIVAPLRFIAAGAEQVVCLDRFIPFQTSPFHQTLYRRLRDRLTTSELARFDSAVDLNNGVQLKPEKVRHIYGIAFEEAVDRMLDPGSVHCIFSNSVIHEIHEIDRAFAAMDKLLAPGGYLIHKIDLRDYGMFSNHGFHPLEFLTVPDAVYRLMAESSGQPNRHRVDYYRSKMKELGYRAELHVTSVFGAPLGEIRPRLLPRFRALPDEDLNVADFMLVARKLE